MASFLALIDEYDERVIPILERISPFIISSGDIGKFSVPDGVQYYVFVDHSISQGSADLDSVTSWLDGGADKVIVPLHWANHVVSVFPKERLSLLMDVANVSAVPEKIREGISSVLLKTPNPDLCPGPL